MRLAAFRAATFPEAVAAAAVVAAVVAAAKSLLPLLRLPLHHPRQFPSPEHGP
ncbi:hypothetical protein [Sphingomonas arenae]|uniref:hypothetical protein n=1 Tax=Sphingomonas arenae TaxID=2812555 RepID=UPI001F2BF016|nr:hypothetical protein [Sphingomonas arenae]